MGRVGGREYLLPVRADRGGLPEVHDRGREKAQAAVAVLVVVPGKEGLSGFPNAETLNLTMSYVDVGLIGHRVQTRKGLYSASGRGVVSEQARVRAGVDP